MKNNQLILGFSLMIFSFSLFAAPPKVAIGDFKVTSDNPKLKYVGKGLSEMFSAQLAQSKAVVLVDREKREALLAEAEFAMSGLADESSAMEAGKLLAVEYMVFGEIIDMESSILVSLSMVKVETGEVAWSDKNLGKLSDYDAITRKLASSALRNLGAQASVVAAAPKPASAASEAKKIEAIVAFSGAVNAVDRKDTKEAKRQIEVAKTIDPGNAAVAAYASKLIGASPRYLVELLPEMPAYNPGSLALLEKLTIYSWSSSTNPTGGDLGEHGEMYFMPTSNPADAISAKETKSTMRWGVQVPVGGSWGIAGEWFSNNADTRIEPKSSFWTYMNPGFSGVNTMDIGSTVQGGDLGIGLRLLPGLGLGISGGVIKLSGPPAISFSNFKTFADYYPEALGVFWFVTGGLAYRSPGDELSADLEATWTPSWPSFYVRGPSDGQYSVGGAYLVKTTQPVEFSSNVGYGFFGQRLIANLSATSEMFTDDRNLWAVRADPSLEFRPFKWLALRGGYEYSLVTCKKDSYKGYAASASGSGFMGGATLSLWGFDFNINYMSSYRPLHNLPGTAHQYESLLIGGSYSGLIKRK